MKTQDDKKLDNPVWFSLSETHQSFAIDYGSIKFYHSDYCPFGGFEKDNAIEILRPKFLKTDKVISTGNYGLADTAKVKIQ